MFYFKISMYLQNDKIRAYDTDFLRLHLDYNSQKNQIDVFNVSVWNNNVRGFRIEKKHLHSSFAF